MNRSSKISRAWSGQAMAEMLLALPFILLMAGGTIHFTLLFLAKVQFEHACGEAARKYASGMLAPEGFPEAVGQGLDPFKGFFVPGSITVHDLLQNTYPNIGKKASPEEALRKVRPPRTAYPSFSTPLDYGGWHWKVKAKVLIPCSFPFLFQEGLTLSTELSILRHPKGALP